DGDDAGVGVDFESGMGQGDVIDLSDADTPLDFATILARSEEIDGDLHIDSPIGDLVLKNTSLSDLSEDDFVF
ncbi:MAG: hypothetical protein AAGA69_12150, partial [Pseudomonadota bacterium]